MPVARTMVIAWTLLLIAGAGCDVELAPRSERPRSLRHAQTRRLSAPNPLDGGGASCVGYLGDGWEGVAEVVATHEADASVVAASVVDAGVAAEPPRLTSGPIVGAVTDTSAKIWIRGDENTSWDVRIWPVDAPERTRLIHGGALTVADDLTSVVRIDGLTAARSYAYAIDLWRGDGADPVSDAATGSLRTLPPAGQPIALRFAVGADISGRSPQPIFERIRQLSPDFMLFIGDQIYADSVSPDFEGFARKYRGNWGIPELNALMSEVPSLMMWDDHDIVDGYFMGSDPRYAPARRAFELYGAAHNPRPYREGVLYYSVRAGDVALFVLDVRSFRVSPDAPDGPDKTMLGAQQKQDLFAWLSCEPATLKVIVSPVVFSDWANSGSDAWRGYAHEREELFGHIRAHAIDDVLLVTGDQHWSALFRQQRGDYAFYEFLPTPLSKERATAPSEPSDEILARDDDQFVFGVVDIDTTVQPIAIALTLCRDDRPCRAGREPAPGTGLDVEGEAENVPFTVKLTGRDLGAR